MKQPKVYPPTARDFRLVDRFLTSFGSDELCPILHHEDEDLHNSSQHCPILIRIRAAWERIEAAGKPKARKVKK